MYLLLFSIHLIDGDPVRKGQRLICTLIVDTTNDRGHRSVVIPKDIVHHKLSERQGPATYFQMSRQLGFSLCVSRKGCTAVHDVIGKQMRRTLIVIPYCAGKDSGSVVSLSSMPRYLNCLLSLQSHPFHQIALDWHAPIDFNESLPFFCDGSGNHCTEVNN